MSRTRVGQGARYWKRVIFIAAALAAGLIQSSSAMEATVVGNQLILTGPVVRGDFDKIQNALAQSPGITTVILRNSVGGDIPSGYKTGELFREKGLRTAVSGYCNSSCSRMFLGGKTRVYTDDVPAEQTRIGFHGHYDRDGRLDAALVASYGLKDWIIRYSDGKADPALVERWINIPYNNGMIHFFNPALMHRSGVSTFMCQEQPLHTIFNCERISKTALDLGIITSVDVITSNDVAAARNAAKAAKP